MQPSSFRICGRCKKEKLLTTDNFYRRPKNKFHGTCIDCKRKIGKAYRQRHKIKIGELNRKNRVVWCGDKRRNYILQHYYKINLEQYNKILELQNNLCAICFNPETRIVKGKITNLAVDHNHNCCSGLKSCGRCVRELICDRCNRVLGILKEDTTIIKSILNYINKHKLGE